MIIYVIRFFQRYAMLFALLSGVVAERLALPDHSPRWLELLVRLVVALPVCLLLYKSGVTGVRDGGKPGLTVVTIILFSLAYWLLVAFGFLIFTAGDCAVGTDLLGTDRCTGARMPLLIAAACIAAFVYALGLRSAIRGRRPRISGMRTV